MSHAPNDGLVDDELLTSAADLARRLVTGRPDRPPRLLSLPGDTSRALVVRVGDVVVKVHAPETDASLLADRLAVAADQRVRDVLLDPLVLPGPGEARSARTMTRVRGRLVTAWRAGVPVDPEEPDEAPWEQAGRLLARLHTAPAAPLPPMGGPPRVTRAIERLLRGGDDRPAARVVLDAYAGLPGWATGRAEPAPGTRVALVHGDWHLGQLIRVAGRWRLIDVDTLGHGTPAWDLARPAAWYAAGVLPAEAWQRFLAAYLAAGGPAVPPDDPWSVLEVPARALTVQSAALAVSKADPVTGALDEMGQALVECCARMALGIPPLAL